MSEFVDIADIDKLVMESTKIFDEPYSDPSTLPSYLISKLISEKYKVAISGDGGDELLGGYLRTAKVLKNSKIPFATQIYNLYPSIFGSGNRILQKSSDDLVAYSSFFQDKKLINLLGFDSSNIEFSQLFSTKYSPYKNFQLIEYKLYLTEMMMLKVDRTSMANSLEVRSPFVDHKLVEYILSTQTSYYDYKNPKSLLKTYIKDDFSDDFLGRRKMGFVFDVEGYIYKNYDKLFNELPEVENLGINKINIGKLRTVKSRINANRLWKILFLENYLKSTKELIS
jgi:asparagine synthase (glutamine-hydrolysing)